SKYMQNEQLNEFTPAEHIHQIRSYFDIIDNAVQIGDTNRKYLTQRFHHNLELLKITHG
ncbi:hypothetical protein TVAGG3_0348950, partial [Trichomonas vaginalis G3]|uniref:hypothetical protein n=1 Tax=Trichomonas vaginalis (strain ATCC PRA-98 / G3) TaxID=412133 RepID=UPI0021E5812D